MNERLAIFVGKGGVGRTTVAAAYALSCARRGARVLLCEIHGNDRAARLFGHAVGDQMREVRAQLFVANVTPAAALEEYAVGVMRSRRLYRRLFGSANVQALTRALPGLDDLMMIGKVRFHAEDPRWDLVVVDAPATGNGLFFLELPEKITRFARGGPLGYYARRQRDLLRDPRRTAVHLVTLAEEMPVAESLELVRRLREELRLPLGIAIVNRVRPRLFDARSEELLAALHDVADPALGAGRWSLARWRLQERYLATLRERLALPLFTLPNLADVDLGARAIGRLADALDAALGTDAQPRLEAP